MRNGRENDIIAISVEYMRYNLDLKAACSSPWVDIGQKFPGPKIFKFWMESRTSNTWVKAMRNERENEDISIIIVYMRYILGFERIFITLAPYKQGELEAQGYPLGPNFG